MKTIYINGRFLSQKLTGVQRYGREILLALDEILASDPLGIVAQSAQWILVVPENLEVDLDLQAIQILHKGHSQGHLWEQTVLAWVSHKGIVLSLCNSGPFFHPRALTIIHDAVIYRNPGHFSLAYRLFHSAVGKWLAHRSHIATVSLFSQKELSEVMGIPQERVAVIPNGSDHIGKVIPDPTVLSQFALTKGQYFLFVGSLARHKNLAMAVEAFNGLDMAGVKFVIVGASDATIFGTDAQIHSDDVILTGRLTDEQIASLYQNAAAFIFPSLYEGFGIPTVEAMVHGCPVLASDIPACREICGAAAIYFDPKKASELSQLMQDIVRDRSLGQSLVARGLERVKQYQWSRSAQRLLERMSEFDQ